MDSPQDCEQGEVGERTTSIVNLDQAIVNTLHALNGDIASFLNFDLLHPHLNQADILPTDAIPDFMSPRKPDNSGAKINNLVMWLQRSNPHQFHEFIRLLRNTSVQAGDAHSRLADALEERYRYFLENPSPIKPGVTTLVRNDIGTVQQSRSPPPRRICHDSRIYWQKNRCTRWLLCHSICWMIILITFCIPLPLISRFPKLDGSVPSPQLVIGTSLVTIDPRVYSFLLSSITVELQNCSGSLFSFRDRNCNFLADAIIESTLSNRDLLHGPVYILKGSSFYHRYHVIAVVKSVKAYLIFLDWVDTLVDKRRDNVLKLLCMDNNTSVKDVLKKNRFCYYINELNIPINHSDYYYFVFNSSSTRVNATVKSYDLNYIKSINSSSMIEHQLGADHNITLDLGYFRRENCYVLNSSCDDFSPAKLHYELIRGHNLYVLAGAFEFMCVLVGVILLLCQVSYTVHICTRRQGGEEQGEEQAELLAGFGTDH